MLCKISLLVYAFPEGWQLGSFCAREAKVACQLSMELNVVQGILNLTDGKQG